MFRRMKSSTGEKYSVGKSTNVNIIYQHFFISSALTNIHLKVMINMFILSGQTGSTTLAFKGH